MKLSCVYVILIFVIMVIGLQISESGNIDISVSPLRKVYRLGEPIEAELSIRNTGDKDVHIRLNYPSMMGIYFAFADLPIAVGLSELRVGSRRVPLQLLKRKDEYKRLIALNRYLAIEKPKQYTINFAAGYSEYIKNGNNNDHNTTGHTKNGQFAITVEPGPINHQLLRKYIEQLKGEDPSKALESAEMLIWANDPIVIAPLKKASKRLPDFGHEIVKSFAKFFEKEHCRLAILEIAKDGNANAFNAALQVYKDNKGIIPMEFIQSILSSTHTDKVYHTLKYILENDKTELLDLVKPLVSHNNHRIQKYATEVVSKMTE